MRTKKEALYAGIKSFAAKNCWYVEITDDLLDELVEISNGTGDTVKAGVEHLLDTTSTESGTGDGRCKHGQVERVADLVATRPGGGPRARLVVLPDVDQGVSAKHGHRGAGGEAVKAVGQVDRVGEPGDQKDDE